MTDRSILSTLSLLFVVAGAGQLLSAAPAIGAMDAFKGERDAAPRATADPMVLTPGTPIAPSSAGTRILSTDDGISIADERPQYQLASVQPTGPVPPTPKPKEEAAAVEPPVEAPAAPLRMTRAGQQRFAAIYARMPADKAAAVLAALTPTEAASFIAAMPEEAGADILAAMPAEAAVAITREVLRALP